MQPELPPNPDNFSSDYPEVWNAFTKLGEACHEAGPLDEKTRRLVKLGIAIGAGLEGATHSAVRNALAASLISDELKHVALLSITTIGFPAFMRAMTWIEDGLYLSEEANGAGSTEPDEPKSGSMGAS